MRGAAEGFGVAAVAAAVLALDSYFDDADERLEMVLAWTLFAFLFGLVALLEVCA